MAKRATSGTRKAPTTATTVRTRKPPETTIQEQVRLQEIPPNDDASSWRRWGPYLSDRAWGTVREDYSGNGDAWNYFTHDQARSRAYRWGEDGIAGISDRYQLLCFA